MTADTAKLAARQFLADHRADIERWIEDGSRVYLVVHTPRGERVAMTGKVIRMDGSGVFIASEMAKDGRGQFASYERIVTLRAAGPRTREPLPNVYQDPIPLGDPVPDAPMHDPPHVSSICARPECLEARADSKSGHTRRNASPETP